MTFDLCLSAYDTGLTVFTGATLSTLVVVAHNDDFCGSASRLTFLAEPGVVYHIRVAGFGGQAGPYQLIHPAGGPLPGPDSDGDGLADELDPDIVAAEVIDVPSTSFASSGHRSATLARLDEAETLIAAGETDEALEELSALRRRLDGCTSTTATADRNDWITDCGDQVAVRELLDDLIANLLAV